MEPNTFMDSCWGSLGAQGISTWTVFGWRVFVSGLYGPVPGTATSICHGNADSTPTGISLWTFLHLLVLPGKLRLLSSPSAHWAQGHSFHWHKSTPFTSRGSVSCLLSVCLSSWASTAATPAREPSHSLPPILLPFLPLLWRVRACCAAKPQCPEILSQVSSRKSWDFKNNLYGGGFFFFLPPGFLAFKTLFY